MTTTLNASTAGAGGFIATGDNSGSLALQTAGTTAVTIDTSQNVGIGTTSPSYKLDVSGQLRASSGSNASALIATSTNAGGTALNVQNSGTVNMLIGGYNSIVGSGNATDVMLSAVQGVLAFGNGASSTERMRIDSSGRVSIGATAVLSSEIFYALANTTDFGSRIYNSNSSSPNGLILKYSGASPNNTGNNMLISQDSTATRFYFSSNGGLNNYSANNTNLSDRTVKKDIELAPSYLNKICAIPVKTFLYNDQTDTDLNLGVIAQDVQAVAPELVIESNWGTEEEPVIRLSVYQTDLQYALMKSIQELKAINDTQAETINALTARIVALEGA
jgi:hypothetical protein